MRSRMSLCSRCGGLRSGWNQRYLAHWLWCKRWLRTSGLGGVLIVLTLIVGFPKSSESISPPAPRTEPTVKKTATAVSTAAKPAAAIRSMDAFLKLHKVSESNRARLAESIVTSAKKHGLNPRLVASIMIVESRGNPFAISGQDAVGIMQIHLPTWGEKADRENVNLLKIEDNVDFGVRILKGYVQRFGVSGGIRRYNGYIPGEPVWEESSERYLSKVREVYESVGSSGSRAVLPE